MPQDTANQLSLTPLIEASQLAGPIATASDPGLDPTLITPTTSFAKPPKKHTSHQHKTRPAFITKIWTMVNDPNINDIIAWTPEGDAFTVHDREKMISKVLPQYFKHSNFASFVRQLNMYGWHKKQDITSGGIGNDENWTFENDFFLKDRLDLLDSITRKQSGGSSGEDAKPQGANTRALPLELMDRVLTELGQLKSNQAKLTQELSRVREDNDLLYTELYKQREKNAKQNDKIEKILQFLASVYGNRVKQLGDDNLVNYSQPQLDLKEFNKDDDDNIEPYIQTPLNDISSTNDDTGIVYNNDNFKTPLLLKQHHHVSGSSSAVSPSSTSTAHQLDESPIQEIPRTPPSISKPTTAIQAIRPDKRWDDLSKSIDQQGHDIEDLIAKLQDDQDTMNFDLDEFLDPDLLESTNTNSVANAANTATATNNSALAVLDEPLDLNALIKDDVLKQKREQKTTGPKLKSGTIEEILDDDEGPLFGRALDDVRKRHGGADERGVKKRKSEGTGV